MVFREATLADIQQMHEVRISVNENSLSDPSRVTVADYTEYLSIRGKGWVSEESGKINGFAIVDMHDHNVWALFVHPLFEEKGIGTRLHKLMLDWYFRQAATTLWLSTDPGTKAEYSIEKWAGGKQVYMAHGRSDSRCDMRTG